MSRKRLLRKYLPTSLWGDRIFARHLFRERLGRYPHYPPVKFNDHLFQLKTSGVYLDPLIQYVTDKEYAKQYVASIVGKSYVLKTYHVLREVNELTGFEISQFPCVIKPTHSSGQALICADSREPPDLSVLWRWFHIDYYFEKREHNYRFLRPKIIVEEFFSTDGRSIPNDFKVFCFDGSPRFIQVDAGRFASHTRNLYDLSWNRLEVALCLSESNSERSEANSPQRNVAARLDLGGALFVRSH